MTNTLPELVIIGHSNAVTALAFSADGKTLVSGSYDQTAIVWEVETGKMRKLWHLQRFGDSLLLTLDGTLLVTGDGHVWDIPTRKLLWKTNHYMVPLACSPDGKRLAYGTDYAETVWLKSLGRSGKEMRLVGHTDDIRAVTFSPDGSQIATGAQDGTMRLWEAEDGKLLATFVALPDGEWIIYTPESNYMGSAQAEQYLLWRVGTDLLPADTYAQRFRNLTRLPAPPHLSPSGSVGAS
jgi:WD40 repeat protein